MTIQDLIENLNKQIQNGKIDPKLEIFNIDKNGKLIPIFGLLDKYYINNQKFVIDEEEFLDMADEFTHDQKSEYTLALVLS